MKNDFYIVMLLFFDLGMNSMLKIGWMIYYRRQYFLWRHMPSYQFKNLIILKPFLDSFLRKLTDVTQIFKAQLRTECSKRVWILRFSAFFQNKRDSKCCWVDTSIKFGELRYENVNNTFMLKRNFAWKTLSRTHAWQA